MKKAGAVAADRVTHASDARRAAEEMQNTATAAQVEVLFALSSLRAERKVEAWPTAHIAVDRGAGVCPVRQHMLARGVERDGSESCARIYATVTLKHHTRTPRSNTTFERHTRTQRSNFTLDLASRPHQITPSFSSNF